MEFRTFSVEEANLLLPQVEAGLAEAKRILDQLRGVRDQLADLRIVWGDKIADPKCPDYAEYEFYHAQFTGLEAQLRVALDAIQSLGCHVKDPDAGLVDFYAHRRGEVVYLCWRRGEPAIGFWHTLDNGFAGRQKLDRF